MYCCSIYCSALVSVYHKTVLDKLSVAGTKVFKGLMGVPRDFSAFALFVSLNVCNFAFSGASWFTVFFKSYSVASNRLTCILFNSVYFSKCKIKEECDKILRK